MKRLRTLTLTVCASLLLLITIAYAGSLQNQTRANRTFNSLRSTITDTSLGYDNNHTAQLVLSATVSNDGPLDISISDLRATTIIHDQPVYTRQIAPITLKAGKNTTLLLTDHNIHITDLDEAIYRDLKTGTLLVNVAFTGEAESGGIKSSVSFTGNTTTGFIHVPGESTMIQPAFKGPLNLYIDRQYLSYVNLVGRFASTNFSRSLIFSGTLLNDTIMALTLTTDDTHENYVVLTDSHIPVSYDSTDYSELRQRDTVYMTGMMLHYQGWNGEQYRVVIPIDVGSSKLIDFVELARGQIISKLGEVNTDRSLLSPIVLRYMDNDRGVAIKYEVEYLFPAWDGFTLSEFRVSVSFEPNGTYIESYGIPAVDNLSPYYVDLSDARELAVKAGLPPGPYPLECELTYYQKDTGSNVPEWGDRYLYRVSSWIDSPDSNPRMMEQAVVDPVTGEVYQIGEFGIGYIVSRVGTP